MNSLSAACVGAWFRQTREHLGLSRSQVAEAMRHEGQTQIHTNTVARIEGGVRDLRITEVEAVEAVLGESPLVLLHRDHPYPEENDQ